MPGGDEAGYEVEGELGDATVRNPLVSVLITEGWLAEGEDGAVDSEGEDGVVESKHPVSKPKPQAADVDRPVGIPSTDELLYPVIVGYDLAIVLLVKGRLVNTGSPASVVVVAYPSADEEEPP